MLLDTRRLPYYIVEKEVRPAHHRKTPINGDAVQSAGGNKSLMNGWSETMFSWGQVTTAGISTKGLNETVIGRARKSK